MNRYTLFAVALVWAAATPAVGCGGSARPTPVSGSFVLTAPWPTGINAKGVDDGALCSGNGGYADIGAQTEVLLTADDKLVAKTALGSGTLKGARDARQPTRCEFEFTLDVPSGAKFYTLTVGRRGERHYTDDEVKAPGFRWELALGQ